MTALPALPVIAVCIVFLDFAIYVQHVVFHKVPVLWRLHRMHHADTDFDVTTGIRFHPIEIILSLLIKIALVLVLGIPAVAVIIFEVVLNASAMFNHANMKLPLWLDRALRAVIVTPDMHRVHIPGTLRKPTAITASACRSGTGCSRPIRHNPAMAMTG